MTGNQQGEDAEKEQYARILRELQTGQGVVCSLCCDLKVECARLILKVVLVGGREGVILSVN